MAADVLELLRNHENASESSEGVPGILVNGVFWSWTSQLDEGSVVRRASVKAARRLAWWLALSLGFSSAVIFILNTILVIGPTMLVTSTWLEPRVGLVWGVMAVIAAGYCWYLSKISKLTPERLPSQLGEFQLIPALGAVSVRRDIAHVADEAFLESLEHAFNLAVKGGYEQVTALHVFTGAMTARSVQVLMARLGVNYNDLQEPLRKALADTPRGNDTIFGLEALELVAKSFLRAQVAHRRHLSALELFVEAVMINEFLRDLFEARGINTVEFLNAVAWVQVNDELRERYRALRQAAAFKPTSNMNRAMTAVATPFLDAVSEDLTRYAVYGQTGILMGREQEIAQIMRAIQGGRQSVVLVGPPGVGKEAIIDGLADLMVEERVPRVLMDKRLLKLSVPHIVSAQGGTGAQERFLYALSQVSQTGNVVLVIENIHELVGESGVDLSSILASELAKGYTFVIGTTTPEAYRDVVEQSVLGSSLVRLDVQEPSRDAAIQILESKIGGIEAEHKVIFTYQAVAAAIDLATRYMHDAVLPQKAIELSREVALMAAKRGQTPIWVTKEDVAALVAEKTRIPVTSVQQEESEKLLNLESALHDRVIGQDKAVVAVASALRRARTALRSGNRPIANFLFLGPTGVGKTELAKATSAIYFANEKSMIRFDMSEFQDAPSVARLIGANNEAGQLTEAVRRNPFSLILLDELEKAHPDILNLFLQVMDDGRLTDGLGRTVDFTNVIIIATSNAGTAYIQDAIAKGESHEAIKNGLLERELRTVYKPEFLNRFDEVIVFAPLTSDDMVSICYIMLNDLTERLSEKGIRFAVTDEAVSELAEQGYDAKFGARPLRRTLQEKVENPLSEFLLQGKVGRRDTVILEAGGQFSIEKAKEL